MTSHPAGPMLILIDGYNVIRRTPGLAAAERKSLASGREALIARVKDKYRSSPHHVVIVFDGDGDRERTEPIPRMPRGKVIFTARGETADSVMARVTGEHSASGLSVVIVSDDMDVRRDAGQRGGRSVSVEDLARKLNEPDKYRRRQDTYRRAVRERWQRDSDDDIPRASRSGNSRKAPKRDRGQRDSDRL